MEHGDKYRKKVLISQFYCKPGGTAVAQWLRCYATNRKVAVSIPADVSGFFTDIKNLPIALWLWGRFSF